MIYLICDGEICGMTQTEEGLPGGFEAIDYDGPETIDDLWFDDGKIAPRPPKPSEEAVWGKGGWAIPPVLVVAAEAGGWESVYDRVVETDAWAGMVARSSKSLKGNTIFTLFSNAIAAKSLVGVRGAIALADLQDVEKEELEQIFAGAGLGLCQEAQDGEI